MLYVNSGDRAIKALAMVFRNGHAVIASSSMEPTIDEGTIVIVDSWPPWACSTRDCWSTWNVGYGSIIEIDPGTGKESVLVRLIAAVGDTVRVNGDGSVDVYRKTDRGNPYTYCADAGFSHLPRFYRELEFPEFFVIGDNCQSATDSRNAVIGVVDDTDIRGLALYRFEGWSTVLPIQMSDWNVQ